jgi:glycosyltransferase involved in cell wall biosynthesis
MKIGFALLSNSQNPIPSTRIACLNLFPYLRRAGFDPVVVFEPPMASETPDVTGMVERAFRARCSVVVLQKIHGPAVVRAIRHLKASGVGTLYVVCDLVDNEVAAEVDATVVVTEFLKSLYHLELRHRIYVVHDGIERPDLNRQEMFPPDAPRSRLKAAFVTSQEEYSIPVLGVPPTPWSVDIIGHFPRNLSPLQALRRARWSKTWQEGIRKRFSILRSLDTTTVRHIPWHPDGVYQCLLASDIGILPIETSVHDPLREAPSWMIKSENRLTLKMALGLPVIATPIPAYEAVIRQGENGFLARSAADWRRCLAALQDAALRHEMGLKARQSVLPRYSLASQAELFIRVLRRVVPEAPLPA